MIILAITARPAIMDLPRMTMVLPRMIMAHRHRMTMARPHHRMIQAHPPHRPLVVVPRADLPAAAARLAAVADVQENEVL